MIPAVIERCAGIDVGRKFLDVCVMTGDAHDVPAEHQQRFSIINEELERLRKWLHELGCTHVVMWSWRALVRTGGPSTTFWTMDNWKSCWPTRNM